MEKNVIVLGADSAYKRQILATIKSICYHNKNIKFYLINKDIDYKWIEELNENLMDFNCEIEDVKIVSEDIEKFKTYSHISSATYFRYFIPEKIKEKKVLYLDSDLVVTGDLTELFEMDLGNNALAGVVDMICEYKYNRTTEFNAGVMLINNELWKRENLLESAIKIHLEKDYELESADQSVLNMIFENSWLKLDKEYNFQVGIDFIKKLNGEKSKFEINNPLIIHYTTGNKPWNQRKVGIKGRIKFMKILSFKEILFGKFISKYDKIWSFYDSISFIKMKK